ncbi:hypothetical protein [Micromonospora chokoriensis]
MTTSLDPAVATKVAANHRDTADGVDRERNQFTNAVDDIEAGCSGEMIRELMKARDSWMEELSLIVADLREMAGNVDGTVQEFDQQDYDNANQLGRIGLDILRDI